MALTHGPVLTSETPVSTTDAKCVTLYHAKVEKFEEKLPQLYSMDEWQLASKTSEEHPIYQALKNIYEAITRTDLIKSFHHLIKVCEKNPDTPFVKNLEDQAYEFLCYLLNVSKEEIKHKLVLIEQDEHQLLYMTPTSNKFGFFTEKVKKALPVLWTYKVRDQDEDIQNKMLNELQREIFRIYPCQGRFFRLCYTGDNLKEVKLSFQTVDTQSYRVNVLLNSDCFMPNHIVEEKGMGIFIFSLQGDIFLAEQDTSFYHSCFLEGKSVFCAGGMGIVNGYLRRLNNRSGHYRGPAQTLFYALQFLAKLGVLNNEVQISFFEEFVYPFEYTPLNDHQIKLLTQKAQRETQIHEFRVSLHYKLRSKQDIAPLITQRLESKQSLTAPENSDVIRAYMSLNKGEELKRFIAERLESKLSLIETEKMELIRAFIFLNAKEELKQFVKEHSICLSDIAAGGDLYFIAFEKQNNDLLTYLMEEKVNYHGSSSCTLLLYAIQKEKFNLIPSILKLFPELINIPNAAGLFPIHAAYHHSEKAFHQMLEFKPDFSIKGQHVLAFEADTPAKVILFHRAGIQFTKSNPKGNPLKNAIMRLKMNEGGEKWWKVFFQILISDQTLRYPNNETFNSFGKQVPLHELIASLVDMLSLPDGAHQKPNLSSESIEIFLKIVILYRCERALASFKKAKEKGINVNIPENGLIDATNITVDHPKFGV